MLRAESHAKNRKKQKKSQQKTHPRTPWGIKFGFKPKRGVREYLVSVSKIELVVGVALTEANQVLGSPLTVSTRRVEQTTSKVTVSEWVPFLAKSRFEKGAKTRVSQNL